MTPALVLAGASALWIVAKIVAGTVVGFYLGRALARLLNDRR